MAFIFLAIGCDGVGRNFYFPGLQSDREGGGTIIYGVTKSGGKTNLYLGHLNADGRSPWTNHDVAIWTGYVKGGNPLLITDDNNGGSLAAWSGYSSSPDRASEPARKTVMLAKISQDGELVWEHEVEGFEDISTMTGDGIGGVILADVELDSVQLQRIDPKGTIVWNRQITIASFVERFGSSKVVDDGNGGAILVKRVKSNNDSENAEGKGEFSIVAQRIDFQGKDLWGQNGILLYSGSDITALGGIVSDDSGGAILVWTDTGDNESLGQVIFAQRIDSNGVALWEEGGNLITASDTSEVPSTLSGARPVDIVLVGDGAGNSILLWESRLSVFVQKLDPFGNVLWQNGGVMVKAGDPGVAALTSTVVEDSTGGAIIAWANIEEAGRKFSAQKVDDSGKVAWTREGIPVTAHRNVYPFMIGAYQDGQGGALMVWGAGKNSYDVEKTFVQSINSEGKLIWGENGIELSP